MSAVKERMSGKILYCEQCGKLIPPEEAAAEDYVAIGGAVVCPRCLEASDPERKVRFETQRSSRILRRARTFDTLHVAQAPVQMFPPPGTEAPQSPTQTNMRIIRDEIASEWEAEEEGASAKAGEKKVANAMGKFKIDRAHTTGRWPSLPQQTKRALYAMLGLSAVALLGFIGVLLNGKGSGPSLPEANGFVAPNPAPLPEIQLAPAPPIWPEAPQGDPGDLVYVTTLEALLGEHPEPEVIARCIPELRVITEVGSEQARPAALRALARYLGQLDAHARQVAREAVENAQDLASRELFTLALSRVRKAGDGLPQASPWVQTSGKKKLESFSVEMEGQKAQTLARALAGVEELVAAGNLAGAEDRVAVLRRHAEPDFQQAAEKNEQLLKRAYTEREQARRDSARAAQVAWPKFFKDFDAALASGDLARATKLCQPDKDSGLRAGGVDKPTETLAGFAAEVQALEAVFEVALKAAKGARGTSVPMPVSKGNSRGLLQRTEGRELVLLLDGHAEVRVAIEKLSPASLELLLVKQDGMTQAQYRPTLWTLVLAHGMPSGAAPSAWLAEQFGTLQKGIPLHWQQRFDLEARESRRQELARKVAALREAMAKRDPTSIRLALAQTKGAVQDAGADAGAAERAVVLEAEKAIGASKIKHIIFQNGVQPVRDFVGLQVDQINRYFRNAEKTDEDIHTGLRVGSHNDLQRLLIRFDGLREELGPGRVIRATLEFYQIDAPKADGAVTALYRLKKSWTPNAGTWVNADQRKKVAWEKPGASGSADAEEKAESQILFDGQKELWRSWDITAFVRETLDAKTPNHGLLLRVVKDEPKFHIRFYPDTELDEKKDPALRPRLVVEFETAE